MSRTKIKPQPAPPQEATGIPTVRSRNKGEGAQSALDLLAAQRRAKELAKLEAEPGDEHPGDQPAL